MNRKTGLKEKDLYSFLENYFKKQRYKVLIDVPIFKYSRSRVDILVISQNDNKVISIEVKIKDFKRALQQAFQRALFSDYVFLAFPEQYAKYVIKAYFDIISALGIGILSISGNKVEVLYNPARSRFLNEELKEFILSKYK